MADLVLEIKIPQMFVDDLPAYIEKHDSDLMTELLDGDILDSTSVGVCLLTNDRENGSELRAMDGHIVGARLEGAANPPQED